MIDRDNNNCLDFDELIKYEVSQVRIKLLAEKNKEGEAFLELQKEREANRKRNAENVEKQPTNQSVKAPVKKQRTLADVDKDIEAKKAEIAKIKAEIQKLKKTPTSNNTREAIKSKRTSRKLFVKTKGKPRWIQSTPTSPSDNSGKG